MNQKNLPIILVSTVAIVVISYLLISKNIASKQDKALIEALTLKYKETSLEVIKQAQRDSLRHVHNYDSIQVFRSNNAKTLLNEISKIKFANRVARNRYADSLQKSIR